MGSSGGEGCSGEGCSGGGEVQVGGGEFSGVKAAKGIEGEQIFVIGVNFCKFFGIAICVFFRVKCVQLKQDCSCKGAENCIYFKAN